MKATFLTTGTADVQKIIGGWDCWSDTPSQHITFDHNAPATDGSKLVDRVLDTNADVVFYIGSAHGVGNPSVETLRAIREASPLFIHICCDGADHPWWPILGMYKKENCFDRQGTIDGGEFPRGVELDFRTLTPIDIRPYNVDQPITYADRKLLGFSGNNGSLIRKSIIEYFTKAHGLEFRKRQNDTPYPDYVRFLSQYKMILNIPFTGTGKRVHIKGRILEAAFCGAHVLENVDCFTQDWFPETGNRAIIPYDVTTNTLDCALDESTGEAFRAEALRLYHPKRIYREILGSSL